LRQPELNCTWVLHDFRLELKLGCGADAVRGMRHMTTRPKPARAGGLTAALLCAAAALAAPTGALAAPSIWVQCDGQPKPESTATSAARLATVTLLGGFGIGLLAIGETGTGTPVASGADGVRACTDALADPIIDTFWERKVSILYSRASHRITTNDTVGALADLQLAREVGVGRGSSVLFQRSLGVSAQMFEALLLAKAGKQAESEALVVAAADQRPYSTSLQIAALNLIWDGPVLSDNERRLIERVRRLDPDTTARMAWRLDATDDSAAAHAAWSQMASNNVRLPTFGTIMDNNKNPSLRSATEDPLLLSRAALAAARAGKVSEAEAFLASPTLAALIAQGTQSPVVAAIPTGDAARGLSAAALTDASAQRRREESLIKYETAAKSYLPLINAIIAEQKGDKAKAVTYVQENMNTLPSVVAASELARRLSVDPSTREQVPGFIATNLLKKSRPSIEDFTKDVNLKSYIDALPKFQAIAGGNRYRASGGWGANGYKQEPREDKKPGISLTYPTDHDRYSTDEMLLLRAAELAKERNMTGFIVLEQTSKDTFRYGDGLYQVIAIPARLDVDFVDADNPAAPYADQKANIIRAADVLSALAPIYIDLPNEIEAAKRRR
jgi:hypothetical protein